MKNKMITPKIRQTKEYKEYRKKTLECKRLVKKVLRKLNRVGGKVLDKELWQYAYIADYWDGINLTIVYEYFTDVNMSPAIAQVMQNINGYISILGNENRYFRITTEKIMKHEDLGGYLEIDKMWRDVNDFLDSNIELLLEIRSVDSREMDMRLILESIKELIEDVDININKLKLMDVSYEQNDIQIIPITDMKQIEKLVQEEKLENRRWILNHVA